MIEMKKILVMSDNHGDDTIYDLLKQREKNIDFYIHCGDSEAYYEQKLIGFICVKGNNDWHLDFPSQVKVKVEDLTLLVTHGHKFGYWNRDYAMIDALATQDCQVLISGHTHMPMFKKEGDYYFINPGSTSLPRGGSERSYCIVTVDGKNVECEFKTLK